LRRRGGDPRIVRRIGQAYALHPGADVDIWRLDAALHRGNPEELAVMRRAIRKGAQKRGTLGTWFVPFEALLARRLQDIDRSSISKSSRTSSNDVAAHFNA
jgi:hypothetical protein